MNNRLKNILTWIFLLASIVLIVLFLYFSNKLVKQLEQEERQKMELWAEAYRQLFLAASNTDMTMELKVIEGNTTIPVFFTDDAGCLLGLNNLTIKGDTTQFIKEKIQVLTANGNYFEIDIGDNQRQYLYYDESLLLHELHYYPYVQLLVIIVFAFLFYYMIVSRKQYEQNRVWVGLSKETAHQLGTPIQSLMGWLEYLSVNAENPDVTDNSEIIREMSKDVARLHIVAERFSKIGSEPKLAPENMGEIISSVIDYMQKRISHNITISYEIPDTPVIRPLSAPLFAWVIENLCKNAVDAMSDGKGWIKVSLHIESGLKSVIEVSDNGKGIPRNKQKSIFDAGYTTKQRGWGLGLTLVKRIVEQYHHGKIYVKNSVVGKGTTFRIEV